MIKMCALDSSNSGLGPVAISC